MNQIISDSTDHMGRHVQTITDCLCNEYTDTVAIDYDKSILYCSECGATKKLKIDHIDQLEQEIISTWLNK